LHILWGYLRDGFLFSRWRQDKGQKACAAAFVQAVKVGGPLPIPFDELAEVPRVSFEVAEAGCGAEEGIGVVGAT
jgi:hypothetical protein